MAFCLSCSWPYPVKAIKVILSASGMADAGRIKHHLRNNLIRANATVLFVGYQAPGTLGQIILSGAREVRIHGHLVPVRAAIRSMGNYSAHADHSELMDWIGARLPAHGALFLTHGEDDERHALRNALVSEGRLAGDQVILPQLDDYFELSAAGIRAAMAPPARRLDLKQMPSDWHNAFADFTIRLSQRLHELPDSDKMILMQGLQARLSELGAQPSPRGRPTPVTPVETAAFDE